MQPTDGLIDFLLSSVNKTVVVTFKEDLDKSLSGKLIGFDENVLLLNPFDGNTPAKLTDTPTFIDLESVCVIAANQQEDFARYALAFDNFRAEYAKKLKRMRSTDTTETI
jgi:small nuclear ribonucleoprotein (snRNP)-like protein